MNNKTSNKVIIALLAVLIAAVVCVGGYFIIKDINKDHDDDKDNTSQTTDDKDKSDSGQSQGGTSDGGASGDTSGSNTPIPEPDQDEIEAGITYTEVRGNDYFIEVQVNGQVNGSCDISIVPTSGGQGHHETDELEVMNKISVCNEDFSLKGMNPGEHKITVIINAADGRTKTLEKIVNI